LSRRRRHIAIAALAVVLAVLAAGCGGDREALTVYSGRTQDLIGPLLEQYSDENDVAIDVRYGDTADLALLISEEGDRSPADVFLSQSPGAVAFLDEQGLLAPIDAEVVAQVDPRFRAEDGSWVGISARQRVLVYNEDMVDASDLPDRVADLTAPEYRGRVAVAPSNGSFQDFVTAMRSVDGEAAAEAWLEGMAANDSPTYANNNAIVEAVSRGEVPMGLVNHYYNLRFLDEDPGLASRNHQFAGGDVGGLVIPSTASVLASSDDMDEAERFIAFLLSPESQAYFAEQTFEYPLAEDVAAPGGAPALADLEPPPVDITELGDLRTTARLIADSGLQ
jgi:iron(III) transport system substrate-binding protein